MENNRKPPMPGPYYPPFSAGLVGPVSDDVYAAMLDARAQAEAAETAKGKAEDAQEAAEEAQGKAEDAQEAAEEAQGKAEDAQEAAETAQGKAEDAQEAAEAAAATIVPDPTLTSTERPAQAKAVGDNLRNYNAADMLTGLLTYTDGVSQGITYTWDGNICTLSGATTSAISVNTVLSKSAFPAYITPDNTYPFHVAVSKPTTEDYTPLVRVMFYATASSTTSLKNVWLDDSSTSLSIPAEAGAWEIALFVGLNHQIGAGTTIGDIYILNTTTNANLQTQIDTLDDTVNDIGPAVDALEANALVRLTAAQAAEVVNAVVETGDEKLSTMPTGTYYDWLGSVISGMVGDGFPATLASGITYQVTCVKWSGQYRAVKIERLSGSEIYYGVTTAGHPGYFTWYDRSYADKLDTTEDTIARILDDDKPVFEMYTQWKTEAGWWNADGTTGPNTYPRTELLKIRGDTDYYCGYFPGNTVVGAYFDAAGNYIGYCRGGSGGYPQHDVSALAPSYVGGDGTYIVDQASSDPLDLSTFPASSYATLYKIHTPANAAYFSLNATANFANGYKQYLCSKEMFVFHGSGNIILRKNDPLLQKYGDKKLCIIGPSTIMINRLNRQGSNGKFVVSPEVANGYIMGEQEYLKPFFAEVKALGYSGACTAYGRGSATNRASIYTQICGGTETFTYNDETRSITVDPAPNLAGYDVFVFTSNGNGLGSNTSLIGDYTDTVNTTYIGALKQMCAHIRTQNPKAEIWIVTPERTNTEMATTIIEKVVEFCEKNAYGYIYANGGNYNDDNASLYSYDGTHRNEEGNLLRAYTLRKALLGF